jgi:hypothetical protein
MKEEGIELVACSAGANNFVYGGKPVSDDAAFRALYGDAKSLVGDQVDAGFMTSQIFCRRNRITVTIS